ncbi:Transposable element Tc3 transposase-like Protein [Tribolium castaneum]|uniref:Transposable element Tc3 transposase-like Protein n=1 Tax=Tribolium castaneum TaxID=7070 RepID=D6W8R7_TRICA|nr:Transposable element Tc3 transposase-like Protein [Tribolium castaneum]
MPPVRRQPRYQQLTPFERGRIVGLREGGMSVREIAARVNRGVATVLRCIRAWEEEGREHRARGSGRPRGTTARQDRYLHFLAFRDRHVSTRRIGDQWYAAEGRPVTMATVYRRIRSFGLHSYRPHLVLPLTPQQRQHRLDWCRARENWDLEWNSVVFSDESRFCLGMHDGRQRVRRVRGERRNVAFSVERPVARTVGVMIWGAIAYGSRSPLLFIEGSMTAQRYVQEVLEPVAVPYVQTIENASFQQDNATPHSARFTLRYLEEVQVQVLPWPPRSPDLSPIEHIWDSIGRRVTNLPQPPQTLADLRREILTAWEALPQDEINHLIRSMPRRVAECIHARGGPTHY